VKDVPKSQGIGYEKKYNQGNNKGDASHCLLMHV